LALAALGPFACDHGTRTSPLPAVSPPANATTNPIATTSAPRTPTATPAPTPTPTPTATRTTGNGMATAPILDAASAPSPEGMLLVPAGAFTMGADRGGEEDEHPAHTVTLPAFWLDRTEVTNAAYADCVTAGGCNRNDAHIPTEMKAGDDKDFARPAQPVVGVTWDDAHAYCAWKGKRLPREAEYEKAMRDGDGRRFAWGNELPTPERTAFGRPLGTAPGHGTTDDVGTHPLGRGAYGHDDLAGNVWQWMEDEYDPFAYTRPTAAEGKPGSCADILRAQDQLRAEGRQGFTGSNPIPRVCDRVLRGGAWNYDGPGLRATNRVHHPGHFRLVMAGFRCAKDTADGG
jgi:formylglycine-generating enzyme required for sulfatase activity